jgi:hypothetical protein
MSLPTNRDEFKQYILRRLGSPVINIEVDENQLDDRVDDALNFYADYHYDGSTLVYYKWLVTPTDIANKYITLPPNIIGAVEIFSIADPSIRADDLFNIRYQIALNDLYTLTSVSMVPYYMTMQHLSLLSEMLVGKQPIRFNRHTNQVFLDTDWNSIPAGSYLLVKCYSTVDPDTYTLMWTDRLLLKYATALVKRQWGENLKKFQDLQLPGGVKYNGQAIYDEAVDEIEDIEKTIITDYSLPAIDMFIN